MSALFSLKKCVPHAVRLLLVLPAGLVLLAGGQAGAWGPDSRQVEPAGLQLTLSGPHSTRSWDTREAQRIKFDLPLLYLHRERAATPPAERTLEIEITGLVVGDEIELELSTRRVDLTTLQRHGERLRFVARGRACTVAQPCRLRWTLPPTLPSDFYRLRAYDAAGELLWQNPQQRRPDFVALDTWDVGLGAYTVRAYYATMFPFAKGPGDVDQRLPPGAVADFIKEEFVPIIQETWRTQVEEWGWGEPLHPDWDRDKVIEIIMTDDAFALMDGTGTYSAWFSPDGSRFPERRIWWLASNNSFRLYRSLADGYRAIFSHEFFHLMQWNVMLSSGGPIDGWRNLFIEAHGRLAPTLQYPELEIEGGSRYFMAANHYLGQRLNSSYAEVEADREHRYDMALYWRFLYEQYGDMGIIRAALEALVAHGDGDPVSEMGSVMDRAFASQGGPYASFEESLAAFARANYALRLENGRCTTRVLADCNGLYYDPYDLYLEPPREAGLAYAGAPVSYTGAISASYGMDFVEVDLIRASRTGRLEVRLEGEGDVARFHVQVWRLAPGAFKARALAAAPEVVPADEEGVHRYTQAPTGEAVERLAVIVTRVDGEEGLDRVGGYWLTVR